MRYHNVEKKYGVARLRRRTYLTCCPIVTSGLDGGDFWGHPLLVVIMIRGYWPPIVTGNVQLS